QGSQWLLAKLFALIFKSFIAASSHEHGNCGASQHKGLGVAQTVAAASVLELSENFQDRDQLGRSQGAGPADLLLMLSQVGRQPPVPQNTQGSGPQLSQIKLLGPTVLQVITAAGSAIARSQADRFKTAGPVAGPPVLSLINVTLHQDDGMAPVQLPVGIEPFQTQRQDARGQIGITLAFGQNQKPAVIHHKTQAPGALPRRP